jgi:hypothetical protein
MQWDQLEKFRIEDWHRKCELEQTNDWNDWNSWLRRGELRMMAKINLETLFERNQEFEDP